MKLLFLLLFSIIILTSCNNDNSRCLISNGEIKTVKHDIEYFDKVTIQSDLEVHFETSTTNSITITAGKNLIPHIDYNIINNELILQDKNGCDWLRKDIKPIVILSSPDFKEITILQACDIKSTDTIKVDNLSIQNWAGIFTSDILIEADSLYFRCHASTGDYHIEGKCNYAYIYNVGSGYLKADKLECKKIHVVHSSIGNTELNASELLMIENIEYGKVYSYSTLCPAIDFNGNDYGASFINIGCQ